MAFYVCFLNRLCKIVIQYLGQKVGKTLENLEKLIPNKNKWREISYQGCKKVIDKTGSHAWGGDRPQGIPLIGHKVFTSLTTREYPLPCPQGIPLPDHKVSPSLATRYPPP